MARPRVAAEVGRPAAQAGGEGRKIGRLLEAVARGPDRGEKVLLGGAGQKQRIVALGAQPVGDGEKPLERPALAEASRAGVDPDPPRQGGFRGPRREAGRVLRREQPADDEPPAGVVGHVLGLPGRRPGRHGGEPPSGQAAQGRKDRLRGGEGKHAGEAFDPFANAFARVRGKEPCRPGRLDRVRLVGDPLAERECGEAPLGDEYKGPEASAQGGKQRKEADEIAERPLVNDEERAGRRRVHSARAAAPAPGSSPFSRRTVKGSARQMSRLYSRIVRSEENFPIRATFRIDFRVHASGSR